MQRNPCTLTYFQISSLTPPPPPRSLFSEQNPDATNPFITMPQLNAGTINSSTCKRQGTEPQFTFFLIDIFTYNTYTILRIPEPLFTDNEISEHNPAAKLKFTIKTHTLLNEIFATRLFRDFEVRIFRDT